MSRSGEIRLHCGCCFIIPPSVLRSISNGEKVAACDPTVFGSSYLETQRLRTIREGFRVAGVTTRSSLAPTSAGVPEHNAFDCRNRQSLPGKPVSDPSADPFKTVNDTTAKAAEFYLGILGRNSVDNNGLDLVSSLNYAQNYHNVFWNGQQMVYGNGDQHIFTDFWRSPDVIVHELTHGVTQHESALRYEGEAGALNESLSDCFGATFNQWLNKWPASSDEGWWIGAGFMGPGAKEKGYQCLRDLVAPGAPHCLNPQPDNYGNFNPAGDVHDNSGIPNRAFALFARQFGGNAWDAPIKVWYAACTGGRLSSSATFSEFAANTIAAADQWKGEDQPKLLDAVRQAWSTVKVPVSAPAGASTP